MVLATIAVSEAKAADGTAQNCHDATTFFMRRSR